MNEPTFIDVGGPPPSLGDAALARAAKISLLADDEPVSEDPAVLPSARARLESARRPQASPAAAPPRRGAVPISGPAGAETYRPPRRQQPRAAMESGGADSVSEPPPLAVAAGGFKPRAPDLGWRGPAAALDQQRSPAPPDETTVPNPDDATAAGLGEAAIGQDGTPGRRVSVDDPTEPGELAALVEQRRSLRSGAVVGSSVPSSTYESAVLKVAARFGVTPAEGKRRGNLGATPGAGDRVLPVTVAPPRVVRARQRSRTRVVVAAVACAVVGLAVGLVVRASLSSRAAQPPQEDGVIQLAATPPEQRSFEESLAVASRRLEERRSWIETLARQPTGQLDATAVRELRRAAASSATSVTALRALAALPGAVGPDLVHDVWADPRAEADAAAIAKELSYSKDLRARASPALRVLLELKAARSCEELRSALERARHDADARALGVLIALGGPAYTCAGGGVEDCNACVRGSEPLMAAVATARGRPEPELQR